MDQSTRAEPVQNAPLRCPCGKGAAYDSCCGRLHSGTGMAVTAEELMRSRYSAFAVGDEAYLLRSWHPSTRPSKVRFVEGQRWTGLEVLGSQGGAFDQEGMVEFVASFERGGEARVLQEVSRFVRHEGRWVYLDAMVADVEGA